MIRSLSFFILILIAFSTPGWFFLGAMFVHALLFSGLELLVLGVMIDAYFFYPGSGLPIYTMVSVFLLVLVTIARPYFYLYNQPE